MNIYITTQGAYVRKDGQTVVVEKDGEKITCHPVKSISTLVLFGSVQVTTQALLALLEQGADIAMMTRNGHFRGRMTSALSKNIALRKAQFEKHTDPVFRLDVSRRLVYAKVANGISLLLKYHYNPNNPARMEQISELKTLLDKIAAAESIDSLRGYEGYAAKLYFSQLSKAFTVTDIVFSGRQYYPAPDPVNALLSFGYSFIARELQGMCDAIGFDPYLGFYHDVQYGRASLSLDLLEPFRHIVVDRLVLRLINKRILTPDNFYTDAASGGCYLKKESLTIFIRHYEQTAEPSNRQKVLSTVAVSYRKIFWNQIEQLRNYVTGTGTYEPFIYDANHEQIP